VLLRQDLLLVEVEVVVEAVAVAVAPHVIVDLSADPSISYCSMGLGDLLVLLPCLGLKLVIG